MRQHERVGVGLRRVDDLLDGDDVMARAVAVVENDVLLRHLLGYEAAEVLVGNEQDMLLRQLGHDLDGVGAGDAHVAPALDLDRGVDVADHGQVAAVLGARRVDRLALDHMSHGAVRARLGQQHGLGGVEQLGALAHKLHAAQHDGLLRQALGELSQVEAVADVIGHSLDLGRHVIVRQDHRVALGFKLLNGLDELCGHQCRALRCRRCRCQAGRDIACKLRRIHVRALCHQGPSLLANLGALV